jgi:uncharacterized protein (TIGR02246 family)
MRKIPLALSLLAVALEFPVALADAPKAAPSLDAFLQKFNQAFNTFDPKEVSGHWAENGTLVSPVGEWGRGRDGVARVYAHDVEMILRGTTSTFRIGNARKLKEGLVLLDLDHEIQNARLPDGTQGTMKLHVVALVEKKGGKWSMLDARPYAFLPMPPAAPAGK